MMRIGSGELRGRKLHAPKGSATRPTGARLKKSLFDVLAPGIEGARVLDLFAGAGALGLEALSRGAARAVFVERGKKAAEAIRRNFADLGVEERTDLMAMEVRAALSKLEGEGACFDVVFADPPYASEELDRLLSELGARALLADDGLVVVEHHHKRELRERYGELTRARVLKSGESCFTLYRRVC